MLLVASLQLYICEIAIKFKSSYVFDKYYKEFKNKYLHFKNMYFVHLYQLILNSIIYDNEYAFRKMITELSCKKIVGYDYVKSILSECGNNETFVKIIKPIVDEYNIIFPKVTIKSVKIDKTDYKNINKMKMQYKSKTKHKANRHMCIQHL